MDHCCLRGRVCAGVLLRGSLTWSDLADRSVMSDWESWAPAAPLRLQPATTADISTHPIEAPAAASSMADEQLMPGGLALSPAAPAADGARAGAAADGSAAGWRRSARFGAREVL